MPNKLWRICKKLDQCESKYETIQQELKTIENIDDMPDFYAPMTITYRPNGKSTINM